LRWSPCWSCFCLAVAGGKSVAVLIDALAEVLTGHPDAGSLPALELAVIDKVPPLHTKHLFSTDVPSLGLSFWQQLKPSGRPEKAFL